MSDCRILFSKCGTARYISHLDLMRTMQRVFIRAGISLKHTEGFNPHPYMRFALPLSVGSESVCELMDTVILDGPDWASIPSHLNDAMPAGLHVLKAYTPTRKLTELYWLDTQTELEYDAGVPDDAVQAFTSLFSRQELVIQKKAKRGYTEMDIAPCIHSVHVEQAGEHMLVLRARLTAQAPAMNPENLVRAIQQKLPALTPDFARHRRLEVYDNLFHIFR
jgi:radical SAM-linked protein